MARNEYSFDGVAGSVAFISGTSDDDHHVLGATAAAAIGAPYSRAGIVEDHLSDLLVTVDSSRVVTVAPGMVVVQDDTSDIFYIARTTSNLTITIPAASGGTQISAIVATVDETAATVSISATAPNTAGLGNPATPANSVVLAYVSVPLTGDPTVTLPAQRFAQVRSAAVTTTTGGSSRISDTRTIQRPSSVNVAVMFNDRGFSRDATRMWALTASNELIEYVLGDYGFIRDASVAARSFGSSADGEPLMPVWDAANGNLWACKGDRGHIVESDTSGRVTTGSSDVAITLVTQGAPANTTNFGDERGLGVQSGGNYYLVGNPDGGNEVVIAEANAVGSATGMIIQLTPGADGLVEHSADVSAPLRFAAPGDAGTVLAGFSTTTDTDFHTQAQNGRVEQWGAGGVKTATYAVLPFGVVAGRPFNLQSAPPAVVASNEYVMGMPPNTRVSATSASITPQVVDSLFDIVDNGSSAEFVSEWLSSYNENRHHVVFVYAGSNLARPGQGFYRRNSAGNAWEKLTGTRTRIFASEAERERVSGVLSTSQAGNGIYTLTRIDGVLCYSSAELIVPVRDANDQSNFWPF